MELTKPCVACKSSIDKTAKLCPICKSFQGRCWGKVKNWLQFYASIVGLLSFVGAVFIFGLTKMPEIRKVLFWKDEVKILSFDSDSHITVINNGDGKVFVSHATVSGEHVGHKFSNIINLGVELQPAHIAKIDFQPLSNHVNFKMMITHKEVEWDMALGQLFTNNSCFGYTIYTPSDPVFLNLVNLYREQIIGSFYFFDAKLTLVYYSAGQKKEIISQNEAVATISFNERNPFCRDFIQKFWGSRKPE